MAFNPSTTATAAIAAGVTAAAAYLDARYHITKDIGTILEQRKTARIAREAAAKDKRSLYYFFEDQVRAHKDAPCIWYRPSPDSPITTYTWTETYHIVNQYAHFLLQNDVRPGELIATYLHNSPECMFTLVGGWAVGSAPAMINYNLAGKGLIHCLKVAGAKVLLVDEEEGCKQRIEEVRREIEEMGMRIVILDRKTKDRIGGGSKERPADEYRKVIKADFPIFLFYTSGTTGLPKACALPLQPSYTFTHSRLRTTGLKPGDVWYDCMPLYHGTGCTTALSCLLSGVTLAIGRKFSVRNFWRDIHDSEANAFVYVGETARYLLAAPPSPLDRDHKLKAMYGNGMRPDVWVKFQERFSVPVVNEFFNSTEGMLSLLNVCRGPFHAAHVGHHGLLQRRKYHDILVPVEIDHETGDAIWRDPKTGFAKRKSYEEGGEIIIRCKSTKDFVGYWNNAEATEKRFEHDVFTKGDLYYRTGDALRRDRDGRWYFLDRLGDTFRWKSENVSTAEVAEVLGRFPNLVEANVYGIELPGHDGRAGCAAIYIRPDDRASFDYAALLKHARKGLPRYAVPVLLRIVASPTPMHNNKQNKVPLRREGVDLKKIAEGEAGKEDLILWLPPGGKKYVPFGAREWKGIAGGKVRL